MSDAAAHAHAVRDFLRRRGFDPFSAPCGAAGEPGGLYVEHPDSTDEHDLAPLIAVAEGDEVRVSVAVFDGRGELQPSLSVTFDRAGRPVAGTDSLRRPWDAEAALDALADAVGRIYARSARHEPL